MNANTPKAHEQQPPIIILNDVNNNQIALSSMGDGADVEVTILGLKSTIPIRALMRALEVLNDGALT